MSSQTNVSGPTRWNPRVFVLRFGIRAGTLLNPFKRLQTRNMNAHISTFGSAPTTSFPLICTYPRPFTALTSPLPPLHQSLLHLTLWELCPVLHGGPVQASCPLSSLHVSKDAAQLLGCPGQCLLAFVNVSFCVLGLPVQLVRVGLRLLRLSPPACEERL